MHSNSFWGVDIAILITCRISQSSAKLRGDGRLIGIAPRSPQKAPTKQRTTIRLSRDVLERFRATGRGWQTRVDAHCGSGSKATPQNRRP